MLEEKLQQIGLRGHEAKIYLALLELGETTMARVAKKAEVSRTSTYQIMERLCGRGLASVVKKQGKKHYSACDPRELEHQIEKQQRRLKIMIPDLLAASRLLDKKPKIKFFEGVDGLKEIYLDLLNYPGEPVWGWLADPIFDTFSSEFLNYYVPKRVKHKIPVFAIGASTDRVKKFKLLDKQSLRQLKIDPSAPSGVEVEIDMYAKNRTAIMSFEEEIALLIESQKIHNTLRYIFDIHWNSLPD